MEAVMSEKQYEKSQVWTAQSKKKKIIGDFAYKAGT